MIIVLPGRGYTAQGPAISIPVLALRESGGSEEVSNVSYLPWQADNTTPYVDLQEMHVLRQIDAALKADTSGPVVFVAKSIGTEILTRVVRQVDLVNRAVSVIWITPLFGRPGRADAAIGLGFASLLVAGSADAEHALPEHRRVRDALHADELIVEGANHSLEVPNDVMATTAGFVQLGAATLAFIGATR
jgi:hypothetical protein